jgi:hypothetical protein
VATLVTDSSSSSSENSSGTLFSCEFSVSDATFSWRIFDEGFGEVGDGGWC